jgi:hypothetical protein
MIHVKLIMIRDHMIAFWWDMVRCEHDLILIRSSVSARDQTDHDRTQGRERFGESFNGATRGAGSQP